MSRRPSGCLIAFVAVVVVGFLWMVAATITDGFGAGKRARQEERQRAARERRAQSPPVALTTTETASTSVEEIPSDPCAGKGSLLGYMEARGEQIPICGSHSNSTGAPVVSSGASGTTSVTGRVHVDGYTRSDGTYVAPHTRSAPKKD